MKQFIIALHSEHHAVYLTAWNAPTNDQSQARKFELPADAHTWIDAHRKELRDIDPEAIPSVVTIDLLDPLHRGPFGD